MTDPIVSPFDSNNLKQCKKCGERKPRTEFSRCSAKKDGLHPICKLCDSARRRAQYAENADRERKNKAEYYVSNREALRERGRAYRAANLEKVRRRERAYVAANRDKRNERKRAAYAANPEKHREQARISQAKYPDRRRAYQREYQRANKETLQDYMRTYRVEYARSERGANSRRTTKLRYRARKRSLPDTFTAADWQAALDHFGGCCAVCGRPPGLWHTIAADHWIPLTAPDCPGSVPWNIVPLCHGDGGCNNSKCDRNPNEWLVERFGERRGAAIQQRIEVWLHSRQDHHGLEALVP